MEPGHDAAERLYERLGFTRHRRQRWALPLGADPPAPGSVQERVLAEGGRLLVIETSATPALAATRAFDARRGYRACGSVPDFYGPGDGKVTFARTLRGGV